jgi:hypothetical protein
MEDRFAKHRRSHKVYVVHKLNERHLSLWELGFGKWQLGAVSLTASHAGAMPMA